MTDNNFRFKLRNETQDAHKRLDTALIEHDLTTLNGLHSYLCVHFLARKHLQNIITGYEFLRDDEEKLRNLEADFDILHAIPPSWKQAPISENYHSLGLIYVVAGSALGSKLLYQNWSSAKNESVLNVKNFMTCAKDSQLWSVFLKYVKTTRFDEIETNEIIEAANYCFGVFEAANNQIIESL